MKAIVSIADQCYNIEVGEINIEHKEERIGFDCHAGVVFDKFDFLSLTGRVTVMEDEGK